MKGIILAGGSGTRLYPLTISVSKQLLPVYDKPMIYYPLSMLMLAGIQDILIITTPEDQSRFEEMLKDGSQFGVHLHYAAQAKPEGLAQAFVIGEKFIGNDSVALVLGDNIFYGSGMRKHLIEARKRAEEEKQSTIFGYFVKNPEDFGVICFDEKHNVTQLVEKPNPAPSHYAATGMYFYDNRVVGFAKSVKKSKRGEYEITDVNNMYLQAKALHVDLLGRGFTWLDTGTHESLADATDFVKMVEQRQGMQISCLEEIAYINNWIDKKTLLESAKRMGKSSYGQYLQMVADGKIVY
jgi:glucose-1-phosphate thymidylyltransferase